ncbi:putative magnesium transporter, partial [Cardiosporidium cionae]
NFQTTFSGTDSHTSSTVKLNEILSYSREIHPTEQNDDTHVGEDTILKVFTPALPSTVDSGIEESCEDVSSFPSSAVEFAKSIPKEKRLPCNRVEMDPFISLKRRRQFLLSNRRKYEKQRSLSLRTKSCIELRQCFPPISNMKRSTERYHKLLQEASSPSICPMVLSIAYNTPKKSLQPTTSNAYLPFISNDGQEGENYFHSYSLPSIEEIQRRRASNFPMDMASVNGWMREVSKRERRRHSVSPSTETIFQDALRPPSVFRNAFDSFQRYCLGTQLLVYLRSLWLRFYRNEHFTWYTGIFLSACLCPLTNVVAISFLPANVVGFAGLQIFFALLLAKFWLKQDVSYWNFLGFALVCTALILISLSAGNGFVIRNLEDFFDDLASTPAMSYIVVMSIFILSGSLFYYERLGSFRGESYKKIRRFALPATIGFLASFAGLGAKAITMAVESIIIEKPKNLLDVIKHWRAFVVIGCTSIFALSELLFLNRSLQVCSAVAVISIMTAILTVCGGIGGMFIFEDYPDKLFLWIIGLILALSGLLVLSYGKDIAHNLRTRGRLIDFFTNHLISSAD